MPVYNLVLNFIVGAVRTMKLYRLVVTDAWTCQRGSLQELALETGSEGWTGGRR